MCACEDLYDRQKCSYYLTGCCRFTLTSPVLIINHHCPHLSSFFFKFLYITGGAGQYLGTDSASPDPNLSASAVNGMVAMANANRKLQVSTWNVAAINNNPFEYWITYDENPAYEKIMTDIEIFLENPGDQDVPVSQVFTEDMFTELEKRMDSVGWDNVRSYWDNDFKNRKIIKDFMKVSGFMKWMS